MWNKNRLCIYEDLTESQSQCKMSLREKNNYIKEKQCGWESIRCEKVRRRLCPALPLGVSYYSTVLHRIMWSSNVRANYSQVEPPSPPRSSSTPGGSCHPQIQTVAIILLILKRNSATRFRSLQVKARKNKVDRKVSFKLAAMWDRDLAYYAHCTLAKPLSAAFADSHSHTILNGLFQMTRLSGCTFDVHSFIIYN